MKIHQLTKTACDNSQQQRLLRRKSPQKFALRFLQLSLGFLFVNGDALAQSDSNNERWYQVELLVFSQTLNPADAGEIWPTDIALAYPPGTVLLTSGEEIQLQDSDNPETTTGNLLNNDANTLGSEAEINSNLSLSNDLTLNAEIKPQLPQAFTHLAEDQLSLTAQKNRLERNNQYRVLKHIAWRQPISEKTNAKSVVITGGDQFDDHFELEGTVSVSASRYLHLQTNLWLTQFYPNLGTDESTNLWPDLPEIPKPITDTINLANSNDFSLNTDSENLFDPLGNFNSGLSDNTSFASFGTGENVSLKPYLIDQIILLSQSRKMRSNELHYIDHPAIGVLAKVTPWEPEASNSSEF